jgi:hypothetical protein
LFAIVTSILIGWFVEQDGILLHGDEEQAPCPDVFNVGGPDFVEVRAWRGVLLSVFTHRCGSFRGFSPVGTAGVEVKETNRSWVFLTETHARKLKKPVRTAFSTREARRRVAHSWRENTQVYLA